MDRAIATTKRPLLMMDELAVLTVKDRTRIGAFLDWGLEKDLFLPFKEQTEPVRKGDRCLVRLYVDKSERLCATMRIYDYLQPNETYKQGDQVQGTIYRINPDMGAFVAVDNKYYGLIPKKELFDTYYCGDTVTARVTSVREDGKLNLAIREKAYLQMDEDAKTVLSVLDDFGGTLPFGEKADPEVIKRELKMSKNAFKRALGRLLKKGKIDILEDSIRLKTK
jgi:predicted RNA-binding protein (virulence factor B family)